jgi:hypothetical protein
MDVLNLNALMAADAIAMIKLLHCKPVVWEQDGARGRVQAYHEDIAGSVPDHSNKASRTNILVSHCI